MERWTTQGLWSIAVVVVWVLALPLVGQRVNTTGGLAPAGSCTPGTTASIPYTADYYFFQATQE